MKPVYEKLKLVGFKFNKKDHKFQKEIMRECFSYILNTNSEDYEQ